MIVFRYRREASDLFGAIYRPVAEVYFEDREGNDLVSFMYIDSGADITLIPRVLGENLGLELDEKEIREIRGIGDAKVPIAIKRVNMRIGDHVFEARIAWALEEGVPPLLGRIDVFEKFHIKFREEDKTIEFEPRP
ncbi:MAG: retropepsin-like domain-containing protein [Desulfobacterales bacterium]|nr:retropepsin-like domain-containing protein [Desulfobacterales bacterium]